MTKETWKVMDGFEGRYLISDRGNIWRLSVVIKSPIKNNPTVRIKEKKLEPSTNRYGYRVITLCDKKQYYIHLLVWDNFQNQRRDGMQVDHIDNDKLNNHISNLQLLSSRDNTVKARKLRRKRTPMWVFPRDNKYFVRFFKNRQRYYLGTYSNIQLAQQALNQKMLELEMMD